MGTSPKSFAILTLSAVAFLGIVAAVTVPTSTPSLPPPIVSVIETPKFDWRRFAEPHLTRADAESLRLIDEQLAKLDYFFSEARRGSRGYAEQMIGFSSKWRFVADRLPWTSGERQASFLHSEFEKYIYTQKNLNATIDEVVHEYVRGIESLEGEMLVRLRADITVAAPNEAVAKLDKDQLAQNYGKLLTALAVEAGDRVIPELGVDFASLVAGEILAALAVQLGVEGGILSAGAGSAVATFGIGLVVGVVVDYLVSAAWNWYADPAAGLTDKINAELARTRSLIVDGPPGGSGLRQRLQEFSRQRSEYRTEAVQQLLAGQ